MKIDDEYSDVSISNSFVNKGKLQLSRRLPQVGRQSHQHHHLAVQPPLSCITNNVNSNNRTDQLAVELAERAVVGSRKLCSANYSNSSNNHQPDSMNFAFLKTAAKNASSSVTILDVNKVDQESTTAELSSSTSWSSRNVLKTILRIKLAFFLSLFKHLGPVIGLVLYTLLGAAVFNKLEYDNEIKEDEKNRQQYNALLKTICFTAFNLNVTDDNATTASVVAEHGIDKTVLSEENITVCRHNVNPILETYVKQYFRGFGGDIKSWDFMGSAFFAITVYTTIGYGVTVPMTDYGRLVTIVYAMIGVPLNFFVVADLGILLNKGIRRLWTKIANYLEKSKVKQSSTDEPVQKKKKKALPLWVALLTSYSYLFAGAALFMYEEPKWNFLTAMYFCFQTFATIGFGDVMPENRDNLMLSTIYILVGMALLSMCMAIITDNIKKHYVKYSKHLVILQQPSPAPNNSDQQQQQQQQEQQQPQKNEDVNKSSSIDSRKEVQSNSPKIFHRQSDRANAAISERSLETTSTKNANNNRNKTNGFKTLFLTSKFSLFKKR